jgi:flavin-dependent dehydrogenase
MSWTEKSPTTIGNEYDCIVMGGGPAGSTVATLVAKEGYRVLLVERERFPRRHVGESLMPDSYFVFERLGMLDKMKKSGFAHKVGVQFVNHAGRESAPFLFRWNDPRECSETWHVPRPQFDQMLFEHAGENGAECFQQVRVLDVLLDGDRATGVRLQFEDEGGKTQTREVGAKVVVDATGQSAILSNKLGLRRVNPSLKKAAIWGHFRGAKRDTSDGGVYTIVLWTNDRKCWFWYIPQADDIVSVGVVGDNDYLVKRGGTPKEVFFQEVAKCSAMAQRLKGSEHVDELIVAKEFSYLTERSSGEGWVLVGDAWGFIDPVYSSGVFFALKSGQMASDCIIEGLKTSNLSGEVLGRWVPEFAEKTNFIRKLVLSFYSGGFRVGKFVKEFPHHRAELTNLLIGRVFDGQCGPIFKDLDPFMERMKEELPPEDPNAEPEDADIPALA